MGSRENDYCRATFFSEVLALLDDNYRFGTNVAKEVTNARVRIFCGVVCLKRILDIFLAVTGLAVLWPVMVAVAAGVKLTSPGPVIFRQPRLGCGGVPFRIFKFRTMTVAETGRTCGVTAAGDCRITAFGGFLRRHKLDELPQLFNVLKGDMSFVGPRPEVAEFASLFPLEYERILAVRPGITHPATLSFRREEEILAKALDPRRFYIEHVMPAKLAAYEARLEQSLADDIRTIIETIAPQLGGVPFGPGDFQPMFQPIADEPAVSVARDLTWSAPPAEKPRHRLIMPQPEFVE
jgi:lipopolysaccharide/colanic/teichoic acid biosynthesis glycosyltransferase